MLQQHVSATWPKSEPVNDVQDEGDKVIVCERGDLVFVFNFNPSQSFSDYGVGCRDAGSYKVRFLHLPTACTSCIQPQ